MTSTVPLPTVLLFLALGLILLVLCVLMVWAARVSFRLNKEEPPKMRLLLLISLFQVLLGAATVLLLREARNDPALDLGGGLGIALLSGLFFMKWILRIDWKSSLRLWVVAFAIQLVLVPVCSAVMLLGVTMVFYTLFPPQF